MTSTKRNTYPLEWLDLLITLTFNPEKTDISAITTEQANTIMLRIKQEELQLQSLIKAQVFAITKEKEIELLIRQYHSSLIILLDKILENQKHNAFKIGHLKDVFKTLLTSVDDLLSFIEVRFANFLSLDERVPATYLAISKKDLSKKLEKIKKKTGPFSDDEEAMSIVLKRFYNFINSVKLHYDITFRDVLYQKELAKGLEDLDHAYRQLVGYSALDELLIYLNFNSKAYMNCLTRNLADKINAYENLNEKIDQLLLHYKVFNQMHHKPEVKLNPNYHDLEMVLSNWFEQEIFYLEKKLHLSVTPLPRNAEPSINKLFPIKEKQKILCALSSDQTGLILRAADESRVLIAKSMNEVFKTIVPHLSTPYKQDLSYDGMRSKSYVAEERDKQIAIETLEKIIVKIKDY